jgi:hypothetical protein
MLFGGRNNGTIISENYTMAYKSWFSWIYAIIEACMYFRIGPAEDCRTGDLRLWKSIFKSPQHATRSQSRHNESSPLGNLIVINDCAAMHKHTRRL